MGKAAVVFITLMMSTALLGCASQPGGREGASGEVVFEETSYPNEEYVASEEDVIRDTVRVTQDGAGTATVSTESNSAFFDPVSYEVECGGELEPEDVSVEWTTLMGDPEGTEEDQLAVAVVSVRTADGDVDVRKIDFVNGGLEIVSEELSGA